MLLGQDHIRNKKYAWKSLEICSNENYCIFLAIYFIEFCPENGGILDQINY